MEAAFWITYAWGIITTISLLCAAKKPSGEGFFLYCVLGLVWPTVPVLFGLQLHPKDMS